jgi:hypothetical protein
MDRKKVQIGSAAVAVLCVVATSWNWEMAASKGSFFLKASFLFPFMGIIAIGLVFFPNYTEERIARGEDPSTMGKWEVVTPLWWSIYILGFAAGCVNYYLLSQAISN